MLSVLAGVILYYNKTVVMIQLVLSGVLTRTLKSGLLNLHAVSTKRPAPFLKN